jgi:hypothetical protein
MSVTSTHIERRMFFIKIATAMSMRISEKGVYVCLRVQKIILNYNMNVHRIKVKPLFVMKGKEISTSSMPVVIRYSKVKKNVEVQAINTKLATIKKVRYR